jgi:hypothetical protein
MNAALAELRAEKLDVRDEDVAHLSPLSHRHLNVLGRYAFTLPELVSLITANCARCGILARCQTTISEPRETTHLRRAGNPYLGFLFRCYSGPNQANQFLITLFCSAQPHDPNAARRYHPRRCVGEQTTSFLEPRVIAT